MAQAGSSLFWPWTETRQIRQLPTMGSLGYQQSVGMSIPTVRAASRMVAPGSKGMDLPLTVRVGIATVSRSVDKSSLDGKSSRASQDASPQSPDPTCQAQPKWEIFSWRLRTVTRTDKYKHPRTGARGRFGAPHARSKAGWSYAACSAGTL